MSCLTERLFRRKSMAASSSLKTALNRCLNVFDVTLLGVGHMIGAGVYVLAGSGLKYTAGPSIVVAFFLAGIASLLSALCYAEFGARSPQHFRESALRFPKAGSAYTYAYVGVGEFWAFVIGWNIILEHMIGGASVARAWSSYVDAVTNGYIKNATISIPMLSNYIDVVAFLVAIFIAAILLSGSKGSIKLNNVFTCFNLGVIVFVVVAAMLYADFSLWTGQTESGSARFMPHGIGGMLTASASCFYAYVGFDSLATAGEEAKNPNRTIPLATFICMGVVTVAYMSITGGLSLMISPADVDANAAYASAFAIHGATFGKYAVSVGALVGMCTALFGCCFCLPRSVYAMANDGLIFKFLAKVPINATVIFCVLMAIMAMLIKLETLVDLMSLGTLMAYSIVAACVIVLRYQRDQADAASEPAFRFAFPGSEQLAKLKTSTVVSTCVILLVVGFAVIGIPFTTGLTDSTAFGYAISALGFLLAAICFSILCVYKQNNKVLSYQVRWVPLVPAASLFVNTMMMLNLPILAWVRLLVWMSIGFAIYFSYGIFHSGEEQKQRKIHANEESSSSSSPSA